MTTKTGVTVALNCTRCKQERAIANFTANTRVCNYCLNDPSYLQARAIRIRMAGDAFRAILDQNDVPRFASAPKMNDMLTSFFEQWGGQESFIADVVRHGKELLEKKSIHQDTTRFLTGMLKLTNENNKRQDQFEVAKMTDEQLKREQQAVLLEMLLSSELEPAKLAALQNVLDAFDLPRDDPNVIAEVKDAEP